MGRRHTNGAPVRLTPKGLTCEGAGKIAGWIDWNNNGAFDDTEKSDEVPCTGNSATLSWKVPQDVTNTVRSVGQRSRIQAGQLHARAHDQGQ